MRTWCARVVSVAWFTVAIAASADMVIDSFATPFGVPSRNIGPFLTPAGTLLVTDGHLTDSWTDTPAPAGAIGVRTATLAVGWANPNSDTRARILKSTSALVINTGLSTAPPLVTLGYGLTSTLGTWDFAGTSLGISIELLFTDQPDKGTPVTLQLTSAGGRVSTSTLEFMDVGEYFWSLGSFSGTADLRAVEHIQLEIAVQTAGQDWHLRNFRAVPEPTTSLLFLAALVRLGLGRRPRRVSAAG